VLDVKALLREDAAALLDRLKQRINKAAHRSFVARLKK